MKKTYMAPNAELVRVRLSQGILDLVIDIGAMGSGEAAAAKRQTYLEEEPEAENGQTSAFPYHFKNVWDEEE